MDLTLTAVCEFLRSAAASGLADPDVAAMLSERRHLTFVPSAFDVGEQGQFRSVRSRALRTRAAPLPPATFTTEQVESLRAAATTARDQFIVRVLSRSGVRVGELLGMRLEHLHFLPDSMPLGCRVPGAHLHVPANDDGTTAARSKSGARTVPVTADVVVDYREYRTERFDLFGDRDQSDHLLINLSGPHAGAPMCYSNLRQILARLGTGLGFRATPHMFRHTSATEWLERHADAGTHVDALRELMDHRSVETTMSYYQVSLKRKQEAVRLLAPTAIDRHGQSAAFADQTDYELASVAVPFGNCTEPTNVKAGGKQCPIRFQCAGCNYYRPDISFLPAIAEHLTELRADRELATSTDAADWVVANMDDQITAFDEIHTRLHDQLTSMPTPDREAIESAGRELRKARAVAFIPTEDLRIRPHDS